MRPGATTGTEASCNGLALPLRARGQLRRARPPDLPHKLDVGAKRLVDGVTDPTLSSGVFYASPAGKLEGPMVDQADIFPDSANTSFQDHANEAIHRFIGWKEAPARHPLAGPPRRFRRELGVGTVPGPRNRASCSPTSSSRRTSPAGGTSYANVLGGEVVAERPAVVAPREQLDHRRRSGGGPTDDEPAVTLTAPDPDTVSSFMNIRVADIQEIYGDWSAKGARFLTPPVDHGVELRCYLYDPDGHLIEVGQSNRDFLEEHRLL